ncbi:MAG: sugar ABC transporter ATP-binding protein [Planctomycetales bacterium]|nr:sugar ABC transporter ATP-binding protein [Planctomycetales bacterium]
MSPPLLRMTGITKRFGATQALRGVSLEVSAGEVLALIGENGAGKSTLMKVLSGAHAPDSGQMEFAGQPYAPRGPHAARLAGVSMIYQELNLAPDLSVEDNIMLGQERHAGGWVDHRQQRTEVRQALALLGHPELSPKSLVRELSVGTRQVVEIARALVAKSKVIVFDEPTSSLTRPDVVKLFEVIRKLKQSGLGIIYISHFLEELREIADRFSVLRDGESVGGGRLSGTTETEIVSLMVGRSVSDLFPSVSHTPGEPILSLEGLNGRRIPTDVTFMLRRGEILGIAGLVGAGRTELLRCLFALDPVRNGQVKVATSPPLSPWGRGAGSEESAATSTPHPSPLPQGERGFVTPRHSPLARIRAGLAMVSEDRKGEGLSQTQSLADNLTLSRLQPYSRFGWLDLAARQRAVTEWLARLRVKSKSPHQPILELSGGNQQKVALARVLHQGADILLLDEPTSGIDVGTKAEIYRLMGEFAAQGQAVLFVSSYFTELLAVCDRIGVMSRGRLRDIRPAAEWSEESLLACCVGLEGQPA